MKNPKTYEPPMIFDLQVDDRQAVGLTLSPGHCNSGAAASQQCQMGGTAAGGKCQSGNDAGSACNAGSDPGALGWKCDSGGIAAGKCMGGNLATQGACSPVGSSNKS